MIKSTIFVYEWTVFIFAFNFKIRFVLLKLLPNVLEKRSLNDLSSLEKIARIQGSF